MGSACAIHIAHQHPDNFTGLIIESGFAHTIPLLARLGLPVESLGDIPDPIGNIPKMQEIRLPLLVIHGERDGIIPVRQGQTLYDSSPAQHKMLLRVPHAGHNDLVAIAKGRYFNAIRHFVADVLSPG